MNTTDLKLNLEEKLIQACKRHISLLKEDLKGSQVFSYTLYCSSGCRNIGAASCTREGIKERYSRISGKNEPEWYAEVNAAEWNYVNRNYQLFDEVDDYIDELYNIFYEEQLDDIDLDDLDDEGLWSFISEFFVEVSIKALKRLKEEGQFNAPPFEKDLLFGMQFGDVDKYSVDMVENVSKGLNTATWHDKVVLNCKSVKGNF